MENKDILDLDFNAEEDNTIAVQAVSVDKFIILSFLSFGFYQIWWMYKTWKFFKEKNRLNIMPVARAIFSIFFLHSLFERILRYAKLNGYEKEYSTTGLFIVFVVFSLCSRLPDPYFLLSVFSILAFFQPLDVFNKSIELSPFYSLNLQRKFSWPQFAIIIFGGLFWALMIVGLLFVDDTI